MVSHDLKSPLVTIRGFLSYLERDARSGDLDRFEADAGRIRAATERMGQLLDDLLELSRTGRIDRPHVDVPFAEVVRDARAATEGRLSARGVRVEVEGGLPVVRGDSRQLVELVQNLLENAAKFMGDRRDPEVRIGARDEGAGAGQVALYVRDNGIGIDPLHQARVFELFHRLDPRIEGTGLGLALARRIVETHGGLSGWSRPAPGAARPSASAYPREPVPPDARACPREPRRSASRRRGREAGRQPLLEAVEARPLRGPGQSSRGGVGHGQPLVRDPHPRGLRPHEVARDREVDGHAVEKRGALRRDEGGDRAHQSRFLHQVEKASTSPRSSGSLEPRTRA